MPHKIKNRGVLEGKRPEDYLFGVSSPIVYEERNPSGDWTPYLPTYEKQFSSNMDSMACVTFSCLNSLEIQHKFLTGTERNFSDRFIAKLSGTTTAGNYLWKVADTVRKCGLIDEADLPMTPNMTWDQFYAEISQDLQNKGLEFLKMWDVKYEWVSVYKPDLMIQLKHAPIQVTIPGHAVVNIFCEGDVQKFFDTYEPFVKTYNQSFVSALKIILTQKTMTETEVRQLQALEGYKDEAGIAYWTGKPLSEYLKARLQDKIKTITEAQ